MHHLSELGVLSFQMPQTLRLPGTPSGTRVVVELKNVRFDGPRLQGKQKGPAGDWLSVGAKGVAALDIRFTLETHDGALIHVEGQGRTDAEKFARDGGPMTWAPRFDTGDSRYAWQR